MTALDKMIGAAALVAMSALITFGGLWHPNTLAGAVARFVFSMSAQ